MMTVRTLMLLLAPFLAVPGAWRTADVRAECRLGGSGFLAESRTERTGRPRHGTWIRSRRLCRGRSGSIPILREFPADLGSGAAPPLFVLGTEGRAELVNYRVGGHYYVVDRLFDVAEFRLGEENQDTVRVCSSAASRRAARETRNDERQAVCGGGAASQVGRGRTWHSARR